MKLDEMKFINKFNSKIYIPYNAKMLVLGQENSNYKIFHILFDNKKYIFVIKSKVLINKWSNSITVIKNQRNKNQIKINNEFKDFFNSLNSFFFKKIKFKGKGFRIKFFKKIKLIKFYFGKSHKTFLLIKKIKKKKINKYKFILFGICKKKIKNMSLVATNIKKMNFYTLRGIRLSRQIIYKRKGKKGTYI